MKTKIRLGAVAAAFSLLASASAAQGQTTFNLSTYAPYAHPSVSVGLVNWAAAVEKETQGRVKINILKASLGQPQAHYDMAVNGIADITHGIPGYTPGRFVAVEVAAIPNVGDTAQALSVALWRTYEQFPALQKEFSQVKILGLVTTSPMHFYNTKRAIRSIDDFKGLKTRVAGGVMSDVAKAIGTVPVLQPAGKAYELLSGGVLDAVIFPLETLQSFKLEKLVKHVTLVPGGLTAAPIFIAMNPAKFNALPAQDQQALMRASGERLSRINGAVWDERDRKSLEELKKHGADVQTASAPVVAKMGEATRPVVDAWAAEVKEKRGADGHAILKFFREEAKKAEPK